MRVHITGRVLNRDRTLFKRVDLHVDLPVGGPPTGLTVERKDGHLVAMQGDDLGEHPEVLSAVVTALRVKPGMYIDVKAAVEPDAAGAN